MNKRTLTSSDNKGIVATVRGSLEGSNSLSKETYSVLEHLKKTVIAKSSLLVLSRQRN